jgi:integrase
VGSATKGRMKSLYNLMYDYAVESGILDDNKARNFTIKGLQKKIMSERNSKKPFSFEDEQVIWNNVNYGFSKMVLIGIYSGWRPQELATLKRENIDWEKETMFGGMKTEAGTDRTVPMHPKVKDFIKFYYEQSEGLEYLFNDFEGQQGTYMTYDKYRGRFKKVMERCGLEGYTPHCTRYTFVTKAKEVHVDEYAIKMMVGHEISDITEKVYTKRDTVKFLKEEILKIK